MRMDASRMVLKQTRSNQLLSYSRFFSTPQSQTRSARLNEHPAHMIFLNVFLLTLSPYSTFCGPFCGGAHQNRNRFCFMTILFASILDAHQFALSMGKGPMCLEAAHPLMPFSPPLAPPLLLSAGESAPSADADRVVGTDEVGLICTNLPSPSLHHDPTPSLGGVYSAPSLWARRNARVAPSPPLQRASVAESHPCGAGGMAVEEVTTSTGLGALGRPGCAERRGARACGDAGVLRGCTGTENRGEDSGKSSGSRRESLQSKCERLLLEVRRTPNPKP